MTPAVLATSPHISSQILHLSERKVCFSKLIRSWSPYVVEHPEELLSGEFALRITVAIRNALEHKSVITQNIL